MGMDAQHAAMIPRREALRLAWVRAAPGICMAVILLTAGAAGGGYFPRAWRLMTLAFCALAFAAAIGRQHIRISRLELSFLCSLAALTIWTELSQVWSDTRATSVLEGERDVVYLTAIALILLAVERSTLRFFLAGALFGVTGACAVGLVSYAFIGHALNPIEGNLLFEPIGYANGLGIYAAIGILLAVGLALDLKQRRLRLACSFALIVLVPTLYLTHSRGAELGVVLGLLVLVRFGLHLPRAALAGIAASALAALSVVLAAASTEHGILEKLFGQNRPLYWHVAWREWEKNRLLGSGAGTFDRYWLHYRTVSSFARDAHSLYLETLAELGPIGLALLLATLLIPLLALRGRRDPLLATAAAAYVAFLLHAGIDWDWELPAMTLAGLACGSAMLVARRPADAAELRLPGRVLMLAPLLGLGILALIRLYSGPRLPFAP
jgi:O-antigen ligase